MFSVWSEQDKTQFMDGNTSLPVIDDNPTDL